MKEVSQIGYRLANEMKVADLGLWPSLGFVQLVRAVARVPLCGGFVADREVADSGLWPSLGFVGLRPTTHSWPEGNFNLTNLTKCLRHPSL